MSARLDTPFYVGDLEQNIRVVSKIKKELMDKTAYLFSLVISGSHLYGFSSIDSDIDYRGIYILSSNKLLGLYRPKENIKIDKDNKKEDIDLNELGKEIKLLLAGNCNAWERLKAKPIYSRSQYLNFVKLIDYEIGWGKAGIYKSYKGMATFNYKKFIASGRKNTVKKYLYVFRALCAGTYALETGRIEPNINVLNKHFKNPELKELIKLKKKGREKEGLPKDLDAGEIEQVILDFFEKIDKAYMKCVIPEKPSEDDIKKVNKWLVNLRKEYLD